MNIGLDLGTDRFRSLRAIDGRLVARAVPSRCSMVDDTPAARRLLERASLPYAVCQSDLILLGEAALESAALVGKPSIELLPGGNVPSNDPPARQVIAALIESLLPAPTLSGTRPVCGLVLPHSGTADGADFLTHLVELRGYVAEQIRAADAVALATLSQEMLTGAVLTLGANSAEFAVIHHGRRAAHILIDVGTADIDRAIAEADDLHIYDTAGVRFRDDASVGRSRENLSGSLLNPGDARAKQIEAAYTRWLDSIILQATELTGKTVMAGVPGKLPLVCAGGPTQIRGFVPFLESRLRSADLPFDVSEIRVADAAYTAARGALAHAELTRAEAQRPTAKVA
ncbi:hypothetical protein [Stratiformator vulcanicus]|uniref:Competence protein A n=1 Tax=Stratiformator vulcanicus TaxID=2527980 RepID=A0A517QXD2_9PLAN|nr:hypothetical protein [Stratiformator vulcanicus]QDT36312.1 hypothetical protein Pan189_06680 [Stratiformator vulcanicus]